MLTVPDPRDTSLHRWCAELALQDASVPLPPNPVEWQQWASFVANYSSLAALALPNPYGFINWQTWAQRVKELTT